MLEVHLTVIVYKCNYFLVGDSVERIASTVTATTAFGRVE